VFDIKQGGALMRIVTGDQTVGTTVDNGAGAPVQANRLGA